MNIAVGVDGSPCSRVACDLVAATSWPVGSRVRLVAAYEAPVDWIGAVPEATLLETPESDLRSELAWVLDEQASRLRARGVVTECVVQRGRAASVLLESAAEVAADLIVVGSRGHGVAATALLGSVSATLADHAPCPVLVVRRPGIRHILLAADASDSAQAIPQVLGAWRVFTGIPTDVVSVAPVADGVLQGVSPWVGARSVREWTDDPYQLNRAIADSTAHRLTALGMPGTPRVLVGNPAREIERAAADGEIDLVITGSRGIGQLQRLLLGSVAHHVLLHARCSVLIMRGHVPARIRERKLERVAAAAT